MGYIYDSAKVNIEKLQNVKMPVIFGDSSSRLIPRDCEKLSLNILLSEKLASIQPQNRSMQIMDEIKTILYRSSEPILIDRFEMLFAPDYQLNILKIFMDLARFRPLYVLWPGKMNINALIYAEPGDPEYRNYRIADYDVIVIT